MLEEQSHNPFHPTNYASLAYLLEMVIRDNSMRTDIPRFGKDPKAFSISIM